MNAVDRLFARFLHSPLALRFLGGASWSLIGSVVSQGLTLLTMMFVARLLGKESYGQFVLIQSTVNMFGVFAGFGIGATATRYVAALKQSHKIQLGHILALSERTILVFGTLIAVLLNLSSPLIATTMLNKPELSTPISISAFAVLLSTLDGYQKSILIGFESMRAYAIVTICGTILGMPIMVFAAYLFGLNGVACSLVLGVAIQAAISRYQAAREVKRFGVNLNISGCMKEWRVLRDFAFPALLSGAMVPPAYWVCQAMLANTPNGYAEVAVLGVAMQWFAAIMFLPVVASRVVAPMLSSYVANQNHADSKRLLVLSIKANAIVALPLTAFVAVLSPWILSFYGSEFRGGAVVLVIAVFTAALLAIQTPVGNMVAATSRMWLGMLMNMGWAVVYIFSAFMLLNYGAVGVVSGLCLAYLAHALWTFAFAASQLRRIPSVTLSMDTL